MFIRLVIIAVIGVIFWQVIHSSTTLSIKSQNSTTRKVPLMNISYETSTALSYLNTIRSHMGMQRLEKNEQLSQAAKAHANYMVQNQEQSHYEVAGHPGFTGEKPVDRAMKFGYLSLQVSENISTAHHEAHESIDGLFSAIYHRFGFLSTSIDEIGVGVVQDPNDSDKSAFTYVMGNHALNTLCHEKSFTGYGKYFHSCKDNTHRVKENVFLDSISLCQQNNPDIIVYPYDKQQNVPPVFYDETPDPLPNYEVSGFPISIIFNSYYYKDVTLLDFTLSDTQNKHISVKTMDKSSDPHHIFTKYQFAIFPLKRLAYNETYHAEITYKTQGKIEKKRWSFSTIKIEEKYIQIEKTYETLTLKAQEGYVLYFPPVDAHDLLGNLQFPEGVAITFLDHNTIRLTVISDDIDHFVLDTGKKQVEITVTK